MSRCCSDEPRGWSPPPSECALPSTGPCTGTSASTTPSADREGGGRLRGGPGGGDAGSTLAWSSTRTGAGTRSGRSGDQREDLPLVQHHAVAIVKDSTPRSWPGRAGLVMKGEGMRGARIIGTGGPAEARVKNEELTLRMDTSDEWMSSAPGSGAQVRRSRDGIVHLAWKRAQGDRERRVTVNDIDLIVLPPSRRITSSPGTASWSRSSRDADRGSPRVRDHAPASSTSLRGRGVRQGRVHDTSW